MSREIKFRAWNFKDKKMFSAEDMAEDQMTILPTGNFINVHGVSTKLSVIYPHESMLPLQYTGLKDKNGKEIYEGDVTNKGIVRWFDDLVWDSSGSQHPGFYFDNYGSELDWHLGFDDAIEVIGNIYENPELLK